MKFKKKALHGALAMACALPVGATTFDMDLGEVVERDEEAWRDLTEVRSWFEVGVGHVSRDSFKHGEYSGLYEQGLYPILNFDIRQRGPYNSESGQYWILRGSDVGLDARSLSIEHGNAGRYKLRLEYDQIPQRRSDTAWTVFEGAGSKALRLPEGGSLAALPSSLQAVDLEQERQRFRLGLEKHVDTRWSVRARFSRETKEGVKATGIVQSFRSVVAPEPVDHATSNLAAAVAYTGDRGQAELGYHLSLFENRHTSFTWQDPHAADWGTTPIREWTLAPDNEFHQIRLAGGYNLAPTTRIHADAAVGRMFQDEFFLDRGIASRARLGGTIDTTVANVGVSARPMPRLNLSASYRYDDRDNRTPEITVFGRTSKPYSHTENRSRVSAGYRLLPNTSLTVGYDRREIDRTLVAREDSTEDTWDASLRTSFGGRFMAGAQYAQADRRGSTYTGSDLMLEDLRQFWLADRDREKVGVFASVTPVDILTLGVKFNRVRDDYRYSALGLTDGEAKTYSVDASLAPVAGFTTYTFYSYEDLESRQAGATWNARHVDEVGSGGIGMRKSFLGDRLDLSADMTYTKGVARISSGGTSLPDNVTRLRQFTLAGDYRMRKDLDLRLMYRLERYDSTDWALDGVAPDTVNGFIGMGEESPDYRVHVVAASVRYRF